MLDFIITIFIFCIVLFLYMHIYAHRKRVNDLEVLELSADTTKEKLNELLDLQQPAVFNFDGRQHTFDVVSLNALAHKYPQFEVCMGENNLPVPLGTARDLCRDSKKSSFDEAPKAHRQNDIFCVSKKLSTNNADFLTETGAIEYMRTNDLHLRPPNTAQRFYDFVFGSEGTTTPFSYDLNCRNFYMVTQGTVTVKLAPPKSEKYLNVIKNYDKFEFKSGVDVWGDEPPLGGKVKFLEFALNSGYIVFVPAGWFVSFKLGADSSFVSFKYRTFMNVAAILPELCLGVMQRQNTKIVRVPRLPTEKL